MYHDVYIQNIYIHCNTLYIFYLFFSILYLYDLLYTFLTQHTLRLLQVQEGMCGLKSDEDLVHGFLEAEAAVVEASEDFRDKRYITDLLSYALNLWDVSIYTKAVMEHGDTLPELRLKMNTSMKELNTAAVRISDGIEVGGMKIFDLRAFFMLLEQKTFDLKELPSYVKKMMPILSDEQVEMGTKKSAAMLEEAALCVPCVDSVPGANMQRADCGLCQSNSSEVHPGGL